MSPRHAARLRARAAAAARLRTRAATAARLGARAAALLSALYFAAALLRGAATGSKAGMISRSNNATVRSASS